MMTSQTNQIGRLFADGTLTGLSDGELLRRFAGSRDADAFDVLVTRHGPMVLGVCRGLLNDPNDAEDAFQATFLILVKKAGSFRGSVALGGWLYLAARRVAIRANVAAGRRRAYERRAGEMAKSTSESGPSARDELLRVLHEEVARLPRKYRLAVVLCDLQGTPQAQASSELRLSERTLRRRLAEGRERLGLRLAGRGYPQGCAVLGMPGLRGAEAAVPVVWRGATVRAALAALDPATAGTASTTAMVLTREVLRTMLIQKVTLISAVLATSGLLAWGASSTLHINDQGPAKDASVVVRAHEARNLVVAAAEVSAPRPAVNSADKGETLAISGRVLDPEGRQVEGAEIYVRPYAEIQWVPIDLMAARQKGKVASTGPDGRFRFELDKGAGEVSFEGGPRWRKAQVAAVAPGFAPGWVDAGDLADRGDQAIRLVKDDVPVRGRVLDSQGRPVPGVVVRIQMIWEPRAGADLDAFLASGELDEFRMARIYGLPQRTSAWQPDASTLWPGGRNAWTTDADGKFEVRGVGRDRIARLEFHGGGMADGTLDVMARVSKTAPRPRPRPARDRSIEMMGREAAFMGRYPQGTQLVGASFDYFASPTKPITGVVRLKGSGKPVAGAIIYGADPATHTSVTARTDAEGRYRLEGVPKAEFYQLRLSPRPGIDPFLGHRMLLNDTEGLKPIEAAIEVRPGVIVRGHLIDGSTSQVIPTAYISYIRTPGQSGDSDAALGFTPLADAKFGLTLPPGSGMILATAAVSEHDDPYVCARLKPADRGKGIGDFGDGETITTPLGGSHAYGFVDVRADGEPLDVELKLVRGASRQVRLVGPDGQPVVGAQAIGLVARWGSVRTLDRESTVEARGLEASHPRRLIFTHKARKLAGSVVLKDEDLKVSTPLEVKFGPAGTIAGKLVDEDGRPWAGAKLQVVMMELNGRGNLRFGPGSLWPSEEPIIVDPQGYFRVEGLVPGVTARISIEASNRPGQYLDAGQAFATPITKPGELRDLGEVKATPSAR